MTREGWLVVHILGVVVFLGNIIVTAVWKMLADRTRDPRVVAFAQRLVTITDVAFTATGAALILGSGHAMAGAFGGIGGPAWLTWGWALFLVTGIIWLAVLVPVQVLQARLARAFRDGGEIPARYWRLGRVWAGVGAVAVALPLVNVFLMVLKPT